MKTRSQGAPICSRCGTRADARRGPSPFCLTCGAPLGTGPTRGGGGGGIPTLVFVVGGFALLALLVVVGVVAFVTGRATATGSVADAAADAIAAAPVLAVLGDAGSGDAAPASGESKALPLTDAERDQLPGNYTCSIDNTATFPCRISGRTLEKTAGSQRFKGTVDKLPDGSLNFAGKFFCPFGDCTRELTTTFVRVAPGRYVAKFPKATGFGQGPGGERVVLTKVR